MAAGELTTETSPDPDHGVSDAELITRVRGGDTDAYGTLFARHVTAARRLARALVPGPDAEDLVSEAFTKTLVVLQGGGGPDEAFRAYLLTAVRRLHIDRIRRVRRVTTTDDLDDLDDGVPFVDPAVAEFEGGAAARAFASLPERWQLVLWHLEVENDKPADIAPLLDLSPNSVSALAYRAREGLRQAFLTMHHTGDPEQLPAACTATRERLGGFVRGALARRDARKVEDHLDECLPCTGVYLELREVNSSLAGLVGPVVLGGAAAAYLSGLGVGSAGAAVAGSAALTGGGPAARGLGGRVRDALTGHLGTAGTTVLAGAAVLAVVGGTTLVVQDRPATLEAPFSRQLVSERPTPTGGAATPSDRAAPTAGSSSSTEPAAPRPTRAADRGASTPAAPATPAADPSTAAARPDRAARPRGTSVGASGVRRADLVVTASLAATTAGRARLSISVSGVPAGQQAALAVTTAAGTLRPLDGGCTGGGATLSCTTTPSRTTFTVEVVADVGTTVDLVVTPPESWTDPVSANDRVQLRL